MMRWNELDEDNNNGNENDKLENNETSLKRKIKPKTK